MNGEVEFSLAEFSKSFYEYSNKFLDFNICKYTFDEETHIACFHYQYNIVFDHELDKIILILKTFIHPKYHIKEINILDESKCRIQIVIDEKTKFCVCFERVAADFNEYTANSLSEYLKIVEHLAERSKGECFYRGEVQNYDEFCKPSLFRRNKHDDEKKFFYDALSKAPHEFEGLSSLDILAMFQHYGLPTRLLDVTTNPLCALFFSIFAENQIKENHNVRKDEGFFPYLDVNDSDGCVYLFNNQEEDGLLTFDSDKALLLSNLCKLTDKQKGTIRDYSLSNPNLLVTPEILEGFKTKYSNDLWEAFTKLIYESERERTALLRNHRIVPMDLLKNHFVKPKYSNVRIRAQSGLFIIFGLGGGKVYVNPKDRNSPYDIKATRIIIPAQAKGKIFEDLNDLANINQYTMFPEFEHLAKHIIKYGH